MTAKGYTGPGQIQQAIGRALTTDEVGMLNGWLLESIEQKIDRQIGRSWLGGTVTAERYDLTGPLLYLKQRPVTAVTAVVARNWLGTATRTLTAATDYAVDLPTGRLIVSGSVWPWICGGYELLEVSYTVPATVPADITEAATLWALAWLRSAPGGGSQSQYKRISVDGMTLEYRDQGDIGVAPAAVDLILSGYARPAMA